MIVILRSPAFFRRTTKNLLSVLPLVLTVCFTSHALASNADSSATISISSTTPCRALGDTTDLGTTPATWKVQNPGIHVVRLVPQTAANEKEWGAPAITDTIVVRTGERIEKNYQIPTLYHIASEPYGADVYLHDSLVGRTPCAVAVAGSNKFIKLESEGYEISELPLDPAQMSMRVVLSPRAGSNRMNGDALSHPESVNNTPLYAIGAATVVAGVLAATCKIKADNLNADYRGTGDPSVVSSIHAYDTVSGISLAATQIGVALISYLLLSR